MSSFTRANAAITYDREASVILRKKHWRNLQVFRYYIGEVGSNEYVDVPVGILSDGATVPWPASILIPPWGSYSQCVLLHDYLCNTYEKTVVVKGVPTQVKITRAEIDEIFHEAMHVANVEVWRRELIMLGINTYRTIANPKGPKPNPVRVRLEQSFNPDTFQFASAA